MSLNLTFNSTNFVSPDGTYPLADIAVKVNSLTSTFNILYQNKPLYTDLTYNSVVVNTVTYGDLPSLITTLNSLIGSAAGGGGGGGGSATSALQTSIGATAHTDAVQIHNDLIAALPAGRNTIGAVNILGGNSTAVKVDGSAVTQPISGTVGVTGVATSALQTSIGSTAHTDAVQLHNDLIASLPAGSNNIGIVTVASTDNTSLYSNTISAIGALSGISTTGYSKIVVSLDNIFSGSILIETSVDNATNWKQQSVIEVQSFQLKDVITAGGVYVLNTTTPYFRVNIIELNTGSVTINLTGRTVGQFSATDILSLATDSTSGVVLNTYDLNTKKDINNAVVLSDAIQLNVYGNTQNPIVIDTTGYQSIVITTGALVGNVFTSNDLITFTALTGINVTVGALVTGVAALSNYSFPCIGRYIRIVVTTAGAATVYLRNQPWVGSSPFYSSASLNTTDNIASYGGTAVVNGGVAGVPSVGGNIAIGIAPTANPVVTGTIDTTGLTRRVLSDTLGRLIPASLDETSTYRPLGSIAPGGSLQNVASLAIAEQGLYEGQTQLDVSGQILRELRVISYLIYQMATSAQVIEEPNQLRNDNSLIDNF